MMVKKNKQNRKPPIAIAISVLMISMSLFLTVGWSVMNDSISIDSASLSVRIKTDIRVTALSGHSDDGTINYSDYNVNSINSSIILPNQNSYVTFKVTITNYESQVMGIYSITSSLPSNLELVLDEQQSNYKLKEKLCSNSGCNLGISKDIYLTVRYKSNGYQANKNTYVFKADFDFRPIHKISYVNITDHNYPKEIIDGDTFKMNLYAPYPIGAKPFQEGIAVNYKFDNDTLVVENVTGDLVIKSGYIQTIEDLVTLSNNVKEGNTYNGTTFILDRNLDFNSPASYRNSSRTDFGDINENNNDEALITELLSGTGFKPIGIMLHSDSDEGTKIFFGGNFDGANHSISNLYVMKPAIFTAEENVNIGLFGYINDSNISNLKVDGEIEIQDLGGDIINRGGAGLIGSALGTSNLLNIENHVNVKTSSGRDKVGGVVGETAGLITIKNCKNYGNISNSNQTGGIVAYNYTDGEVYIENCENYGIILNEKGSTAIGGIIGHSTDTSKKTTIKNSRNYGKISTGNSIASEQKVGGIAGNIYGELLIENCENHGEIIVEDTTAKPTFSFNGGGILGRKSGGNGVIKNCHNYAKVTGQYRLGGIVGHINGGGTITIVNSSNHGTLSEMADVNGNGASGGILGVGNAGIKINVLNSYNSGNISSYENAAGILGNVIDANNANAVNIVNSYNIGDVTANIYADGILNIGNAGIGSAAIKINNIYNLGTLTGKKASYGMGYINSTLSQSVVNAYYQNSYSGSNQSYGGTAMAVTNMKNQSFVDTLNTNKNSIELSKIDSNLSSYSLCNWKLGTSDYPELDCK